MTHEFELGAVRVSVTLPDLPEGVAVSVDVDIRARTEEAARAVIEVLGGTARFKRPLSTHGDEAHLGMLTRDVDDWTYGPLEVTLLVPTGRARPVTPAPFIEELFPKAAGS